MLVLVETITLVGYVCPIVSIKLYILRGRWHTLVVVLFIVWVLCTVKATITGVWCAVSLDLS